MFDKEKDFFPPRPDHTGAFPSEKPRYTMTEEVEHTAREMKNTIDRLLKFEKRLEDKFSDMLKHITSDNAIFKDTFSTGYNQFLQEVKNEVNVFENNVDSSINLFKSTLESDYATLSEDCKKQIEDNYNAFVESLTAYKEELSGIYDTFRDAIENRLEQHDTTYTTAFNDYATSVNSKLVTMEGKFSEDYRIFTEQVNTSVNSFKNQWINTINTRLDEQDSIINDVKLYYYTNLKQNVENKITEMRVTGELASIINDEILSHKVSVEQFESAVSDLATKSELETERQRINNLATLPSGSTTGDAELIDGRTADDGTVYSSLGEHIRKHFANGDIIICNSDETGGDKAFKPFDFDFNAKIVTVNNKTAVYSANKRLFISDSEMTISIPVKGADGQSKFTVFCFDVINKTFKFTDDDEARNAKYIPVAILHNFNDDIMIGSLYCPYPYTVNGSVNATEQKARINSHRFAVMGNAHGNPIKFDTVNKTVTIPQHSYIYDGAIRYAYNGESDTVLDYSSVTGLCGISYNIDTDSWIVIDFTDHAYDSANTLFIGCIWVNAETVVCASKHTVNGSYPIDDDVIYGITEDVITALAPELETLANKKILVIGDSISADYYGDYPKWVTNLINSGFFTAGNVTNDSIHATGYVATYNDEANDFCTRIKAVANPDQYDMVIVFGGINDYIQNVDFTEFAEAVNDFYEYLVNTFTNARICVFTPLRTHATWNNTVNKGVLDYCEYIRDIATSYALPVLNLTDESGFCPWVSAFNKKWTLIPEGYTDNDGVHPNEEYISKFLTPMIKKFLRNLM